MSANTRTENRRIVFLKDDAGWYADMEGTRAQNAMVSGEHPVDIYVHSITNG